MEERHIYIYGPDDFEKTKKLIHELKKLGHPAEGYTWGDGGALYMRHACPKQIIIDDCEIIIHHIDIPKKYKMELLAVSLADQANEMHIPMNTLPEGVRVWINELRSSNIGNWLLDLRYKADLMPMEELAAWLQVFPICLFRSELEVSYKCRLQRFHIYCAGMGMYWNVDAGWIVSVTRATQFTLDETNLFGPLPITGNQFGPAEWRLIKES